jgi:hypothetical protein
MTFFIGTPHTHNAGHFINRDANGRATEDDVQTCKHCQAVVLMREWKEEGGWCAKCESPLCNNPACMEQTSKMGCVPFAKQVELYVEHSHKIEQLIRTAGLEPPVPSQPIFTG